MYHHSKFQREPVISSVTQNKCDELCAIYHMVEFNLKERERERLQAFTALVMQMQLLFWIAHPTSTSWVHYPKEKCIRN